MRVKSSMAVLIAGMLAASVVLSGCTSSPTGTKTPSPTPIATTTATPTVAPTVVPGSPSDNEWGVDVSKVILPVAVTSAYGTDGTKNLVTDALTIFDTALNSTSDLHVARTNDEASYYEPLREYMTSDAYDELLTSALAVNDVDRNLAGSLVAKSSRDGSLTIDNVAYTSNPDSPFFWTMLDIPRISLLVGTTAASQMVAVDITVKVTIPTLQGKTLTETQVRRITLVPNTDSHWIISGWGSNPVTQVSTS